MSRSTLPRLFGLTLSLVLCAAAQAQGIWKWRDAEGRIQISDRPPASSVPESAILQRPGNAVQRAAAQATSSPAPSADAASAPKVDKELEDKKRKQATDKQAAEQAEEKARKEKAAQQKADTCRRARNDLAAVNNGMRIARANEKGEREFLDDSGRAAEGRRLQQLVNDTCQ